MMVVVGQRCLVFQLLHCLSIPHKLCNFLSNRKFQFMGVGINKDVEKLSSDYNIEVAIGEHDRLKVFAAEVTGRRELGLKGQAMEVLRREVEKPRRVQMGRWDNKCLNMDQIMYACVDAFLAFHIERRLMR